MPIRMHWEKAGRDVNVYGFTGRKDLSETLAWAVCYGPYGMELVPANELKPIEL